MSELTLARALLENGGVIHGTVLTVETNSKGDGSKRAEVIKVEVVDVKVVQPGNANILVQEVIPDLGRNPLSGLFSKKKESRKLSLGANTKVK